MAEKLPISVLEALLPLVKQYEKLIKIDHSDHGFLFRVHDRRENSNYEWYVIDWRNYHEGSKKYGYAVKRMPKNDKENEPIANMLQDYQIVHNFELWIKFVERSYELDSLWGEEDNLPLDRPHQEPIEKEKQAVAKKQSPILISEEEKPTKSAISVNDNGIAKDKTAIITKPKFPWKIALFFVALLMICYFASENYLKDKIDPLTVTLMIAVIGAFSLIINLSRK